MDCIFQTETGSVYQISGSRARRIKGLVPPTPRIGEDLTWRELLSHTSVRVGHSVLFYWAPGIQPAATRGAEPATLTSHVALIIDSPTELAVGQLTITS